MKHHNNLTDDQIHLPKGFQPASNRSVLIKNSSGGLVWDKANYTSSIVVSCVADSGGDLHHRYFCLFSSDDANKYAVYFDVTSVASFSTPDGYTDVIQVDCTATGSDSTAIEVAGYLQTAINGHADFSSTDDSAGTITITGVTTATDAVDSSTGFTINTTQTKINNEVLVTDSSGNITWKSQREVVVSTTCFKGYSTVNGSTYEAQKNFTDGQAPFEHDRDYTSGTVGDADMDVSDFMKAGGYVVQSDCTATKIKGWMTINANGNTATLAICKVTPVDGVSTALTPTLIKEMTITGISAGLDGLQTISETTFDAADLNEGDILFTMVKGDTNGNVVYFNTTLELQYK